MKNSFTLDSGKFLSAKDSRYTVLDKYIYICIHFYSYSRIDTDENNIKMWTVLLTTIRKARNHCQDVDHCQDEDNCHYMYQSKCKIKGLSGVQLRE